MPCKTLISLPQVVLKDKSSCCLWCNIEPDNASDRFYDVFVFPVRGYSPHSHQPPQKPRDTVFVVIYTVHILPFQQSVYSIAAVYLLLFFFFFYNLFEFINGLSKAKRSYVQWHFSGQFHVWMIALRVWSTYSLQKSKLLLIGILGKYFAIQKSIIAITFT